MRTTLRHSGFAFLPNNPGATPISQITVSDNTDDDGNLTVSFGDNLGSSFVMCMQPSQWRIVCDTLIASHPHIRWNVGSIA